ncbi:uncharacterized protein F4812DRAFT_459631 [Daldinia caldariorum]|uniref:uncharacterized protein n=1 Tax=Daldinia caldariorum TaxID=326644 RepID=UPI002007B7DD|nr:uncharacterized protein F4812DRAFT_459631 [Daldinia caldariorum]KAI1467526.1 hypothetical protein F4812DRAFT_459631 [Daldinia caldariorum]
MLLSSESSLASSESEESSELQSSGPPTRDSEFDRDFPREISEDIRPVSPITDRWPNHNPWEYYIDRDGNAVPSPPEQPAAPPPVRQPQPPFSLGDLDIAIDYHQPGKSPRCTYPNFHEQLTIRQRRQLKRLANTLKQPVAIILPAKRNYYGSHLVIHNLDQERVWTDLASAKHPLAPLAELEEANSSYDSHDENQSIAVADEEYPEASNQSDAWEDQDQDELSSMDNSNSVNGNGDQPGIDRYLASIEDPVQRQNTILAGITAMWPSNHEVNNVWPHPHYRGFEEDGDYETWFRNSAHEFGWDNDDPYYEPEDDETWREVYQPQIGDEGIPDQEALDYVLIMRENHERLEAAIRRRRERWEEMHGSHDSFAATFSSAYDAGNEHAAATGKADGVYDRSVDSGEDADNDNDDDDEEEEEEEAPSPPRRPIRFKLVARPKAVAADEDALAVHTSQETIGPSTSSSMTLNSATVQASSQASTSPPSSASLPKPSRGRKRKADPDADFEPESSGPDVQNAKGRKRRRTTRQ